MDSIPNGSVSGQQDWQWNRLQEERRAAAQSQRARSANPRQQAPPQGPRRTTAPDEAWADRQTLVATLERKDRRLRAVITRYERLLEERNRELDQATSGTTWTSPTRTLVQALRRLVARW